MREEADRVRFCLELRGAVEEKSGIGGSMVRATGKKRTRRSRHAAGAGSGGDSAAADEVAEASLGDETRKAVAHFAERAFRGRPGGMRPWNDVADTVAGEEKSGTDQNGFSQAEAWMSEPEWNGESSEVMGETSAGSREPECGMD